MRAIIEATLVLTTSLFVTLLILAALFARHPLGAGQIAYEEPIVSPAVFIEGTHESPDRIGEQIQMRTGLIAGIEGCPYLAALATASPCPAAPQSSSARACPYLHEIYRPHLDAHGEPVRVSGHDI